MSTQGTTFHTHDKRMGHQFATDGPTNAARQLYRLETFRVYSGAVISVLKRYTVAADGRSMQSVSDQDPRHEISRATIGRNTQAAVKAIHEAARKRCAALHPEAGI